MKEILIEICGKLRNPTNPEVYYEYREQTYPQIWNTEYHLIVVEKKKATGTVSGIIFRKCMSVTKEMEMLMKVPVDIVDIARKEFLVELVQYGVMSAIDSMNKYKNDKTTDNK